MASDDGHGHHIGRSTYRWFHDHVQSIYCDPLIARCFLPFGGERGVSKRSTQGGVFQVVTETKSL
jgi:hypothetical protein